MPLNHSTKSTFIFTIDFLFHIQSSYRYSTEKLGSRKLNFLKCDYTKPWGKFSKRWRLLLKYNKRVFISHYSIWTKFKIGRVGITLISKLPITDYACYVNQCVNKTLFVAFFQNQILLLFSISNQKFFIILSNYL